MWIRLWISIFRNGSTGGTDIITMVLRKKYSNLDIGTLSFALNCNNSIYWSFNIWTTKALYTLISMFVQSIVLDKSY